MALRSLQLILRQSTCLLGIMVFIFCSVHREMYLIQREKEKIKKGHMSYDNFEHSCTRGMARRPWVGAMLTAKMEDWSWEMKMFEKEMEGERARPWPGRIVIQMKLEAYEFFFFLYPNAHLLATSYNRPSEWDRVSVRGRETAKPHERMRLHLSF